MLHVQRTIREQRRKREPASSMQRRWLFSVFDRIHPDVVPHRCTHPAVMPLHYFPFTTWNSQRHFSVLHLDVFPRASFLSFTYSLARHPLSAPRLRFAIFTFFDILLSLLLPCRVQPPIPTPISRAAGAPCFAFPMAKRVSLFPTLCHPHTLRKKTRDTICMVRTWSLNSHLVDISFSFTSLSLFYVFLSMLLVNHLHLLTPHLPSSISRAKWEYKRFTDLCKSLLFHDRRYDPLVFYFTSIRRPCLTYSYSQHSLSPSVLWIVSFHRFFFFFKHFNLSSLWLYFLDREVANTLPGAISLPMARLSSHGESTCGTFSLHHASAPCQFVLGLGNVNSWCSNRRIFR